MKSDNLKNYISVNIFSLLGLINFVLIVYAVTKFLTTSNFDKSGNYYQDSWGDAVSGFTFFFDEFVKIFEIGLVTALLIFFEWIIRKMLISKNKNVINISFKHKNIHSFIFWFGILFTVVPVFIVNIFYVLTIVLKDISHLFAILK